MNFADKDIAGDDTTTQTGLKSVLEQLCGESIKLGCSIAPPCQKCQGCVNWSVLGLRLKAPRLTLEALNDILLLVDQFPLGQGFWDFFLSSGNKEISFDQLKQGITRFKGYAVLKYGNVRYAYRKLYKLELEPLKEALGKCCREAQRIKADYGKRRPAPALPREIAASDTWLLGYLAKAVADRDLATYFAMAVLAGEADEAAILGELSKQQTEVYTVRKRFLEAVPRWKEKFRDLSTIREDIEKLSERLDKIRYEGWENTTHYLASDCMDVYVATSMREEWEFQDVRQTVKSVFGDGRLKDFRLRYFDPTQSYLDNRVDKGLVEALMLKRSDCTLYLIQETDTFGKDSELATTLAQGKPVIAFLPEIDVIEHARIAARRPLAYLQKRLLQLMAEGKLPQNGIADALDFLKKLSQFQPFYRLIGDEEAQFIAEAAVEPERKKICSILADGERDFFDSRASTLRERHPLSLQVQLQTGVANGVLVVRKESDCAELLSKLLTNSCSFEFDHKELGIERMVESISKSPFRVVTKNDTLTNAFWSLYFTGSNR